MVMAFEPAVEAVRRQRLSRDFLVPCLCDLAESPTSKGFGDVGLRAWDMPDVSYVTHLPKG
jgi:hypothetical protein